MNSPLVPKRLITRSLFQLPSTRFPSLLDDLEEEMSQWGWEQSGLTIAEDDQSLFVEAQMPGLKAEDIHVTIDNGVLRISGERSETEDDKSRRFHRKASYSFNYRLTLPGQISEDSTEATYKDGVMKVTFGKAPDKRGKRIEVKGQ